MSHTTILNELFDQVKITINSLGRVRHDNTWTEQQLHKDYDMWVIMSGSVTVRSEAWEYTLKQGDIALFSPDLYYHSYSEEGFCSFIFLHFNFLLGENPRFLDMLNFTGIVRGDSIHKEYQDFLYAMECHYNKTPLSSLILKGYFTVLLAKTLQIKSEERSMGSVEGYSLMENIKRLRPVLDYIDHHLYENISVSELHSLAGFSCKYFFTVFRKVLGMSPNQYILHLKMNRARELLLTREYRVKEIAYMLGYPDPFSFSKTFKKRFGVSPSEFNNS